MKFSNLLRNMIVEASRLEVLMDKFVKPKKDSTEKPLLSKMELQKLIQGDPTSRLNNVDLDDSNLKPQDLAKVKVGAYTPWLIKQYLSPQTESTVGERGYEQEVKQLKDRFFEDLYKVTEDLLKFERFKGRLDAELRDINKLTIDQLADAVGRFSLEKTKATAQEKKEASKSYAHPGGDVIYRGSGWTVVKISRNDELGKEAACFYGGNQLKSGKGETNWCTSAPGLNYFNNYIKDGPLYVVIPNQSKSFKYGDVSTGEVSGLPADRFQFHFPSNQFMDADDRQIDLVKFLNDNEELKELFKPEFAKGLTTGDGETLSIEGFDRGSIGKFVGLYGLDELFESLPNTLTDISISNPKSDQNIIITIPKSISKFKNLQNLSLSNCINEVPVEVCQLNNLEFLGFMNNPQLTSIPECLASMESIYFMNIDGSPNIKLPEIFHQKWNMIDDGLWENEQ
jgi:Leucine-rich repeat (LRR) protein